MRLKEDKSNWKASNIIRKIAVIPDEPAGHTKKNTRKWCKGKVGVKHNYEVFERHEGNFFLHTWTVYKCKNCGKKKY